MKQNNFRIKIRNALSAFAIVVSVCCPAQNVYDTYNPSISPVDSIVATYQGANSNPGFPGEYQLFDNLLTPWLGTNPITNQAYVISYRIEPVSFPFGPDCSNGDCENVNSTTRNLILLRDYTYEGYLIQFPFSDPPSQTMTRKSTLASAQFCATDTGQSYIPHTILKHTYYLHAGTNELSPVIDSFSFVLDHTRGYLSRYPFRNQNDDTDESEHDIAIHPWFIYPNADSFLTVPPQQTNFMGTLDYYPYPAAFHSSNAVLPVWAQIPDPTGSDMYYAPDNFTHPAPFSLVGIMVGNSQESYFAGFGGAPLALKGGVDHTYYIDTAMDLRTINPSERIIYNPSAAYITAADPVVFPSGYTFKTVGGIYPTVSQVASLDPDTMYADLRDVPITGSALNLTDNPNTSAVDSLSYYYVTAGCTLRIEPCVTIYDAIIVVQTGGRIELDTNNVGGNYILQINSGGVLSQQNSNPNVPCSFMCFESSHYNQRHVTISSNTTWDTTNIESSFPGNAIWSAATNNTAKFVEGITIDSGITLTIGAGVSLLFGPNGKIIVKKGGRLIVNGTSTDSCHFGAACQLEWQGIEVWGDSSKTQFVGTGYPPHQGYLYMEYCIIDHARDAVTLGQPGTARRNGGVIKAYHCSFLNNVHDVVFQPYRNFVNTAPYYPTSYNTSKFGQCEFRTTEYFFDPALNTDIADGSSSATAHIVLNGVRIRNGISSCTFANDNPENYAPHLRGVGISGFESTLILQSQNPNHFENLSDGVWMKGVGTSANAMNLSAQVFDNNIHSIVCEGTRNSAILQNEINVPESPQYGYQGEDLELGYDKPVGVFMLGSIDYKIEENEFNVGDTSAQIIPTSTCDDCSYNIVVYNTTWPTPANTGSGTIYKNDIHHASIGIQVQGNNGSGYYLNPGLDIKCNDFEERVFFDVILTGRGFSPNVPSVQSTMKDQGFCDPNSPQLKATNYFAACSLPVDSQVRYTSGTAVNFEYNDLSGTLPGCYNVAAQPCPSTDTITNPCNSNLTGLYWAPIIVKYNTSTTAHETARHVLDSLVDGGDTEDLLDKIDKNEGDVLNSILSSASPWLSDVVLLALLETPNREKLSEEQLVSILLQNGRLSPEVYAAMLVSEPELSSGSYDELAANQSAPGTRELKEQEWEAWLFNADLAAITITEYAMATDSLQEGIEALADAKTVAEMQKLFTLQLAAREFEDANTTLENILTAQGEATFWTVLAEISYVQAQENRTWLEATLEEIQTADSIWQVYGDNVIGARSAVAAHTGQGFVRSPFPLEPSGERRQNPETNATSTPVIAPFMKVYPNPATNTATITVKGAMETSSTIEVVNAIGQVVERIVVRPGENALLNLSTYPNGILYLRLMSQGECLDTEKLIILR